MTDIRDAIMQEAEVLPTEAMAELLAHAIRLLAARGAATPEQLSILRTIEDHSERVHGMVSSQRTQMDTAIQMFKFENKQEIRVIQDDSGEPWFVASGVCKALQYANTSKTLSDHVDKEDIRYFALGAGQVIGGITADYAPGSSAIINESGLYSLTFSSTLPEAKRFKRWVTSEVLPAIRKHGSYVVPGREPSAFDVLEQMFATIKEIRGEFGELRYDVCEVRRDVDEIKAAQGKAEVNLLPAQTSDTGYRTVVGYANMHGIRLTNEAAKDYGHRAAQWSRENGYAIGKAPDTRFGTVGTYHIDALDWVFGMGNNL